MNIARSPGEFTAGVSTLFGAEHFAVSVAGNESKIVAVTGPVGGVDEGESIGNAMLFAAAPKLLAALEALTAWGRDHTSPTDANSPHKLLIDAIEAMQAARGELPC